MRSDKGKGRESRAESRVVVANPADGGVFYWLLKLYMFVAVLVSVSIFVYGRQTFRSEVVDHTPSVPDFANASVSSPGITRIVAADGTLLAEFAREYREVAPFEAIPKQLVDAFLAVEDHDFWNHKGIYYKGFARAVWANLTEGEFAQGGSTITQQLAKQFLSSEKSIWRKAREAVLARRLEATYSKRAILSMYLNKIYLGSQAWGVTAAAHRYFQKELSELTLAESALIAGLAKAPSAYSPLRAPELAQQRRDVVLDKMEKHGLAAASDVAAAKAEPIRLRPFEDVFPNRMPYYAQHVQSYIADTYGKDELLTGGLLVETAAEPAFEAAAYGNVDFGTRHQDKRQGWRGPEWRVDDAGKALVIERQTELYGDGPLDIGKRYLAVVDKVRGDGADVIVGRRRLRLPLANMRWAAAWKSGNADNDLQISSATQALRAGDVVWVKRESRLRGRFADWHLPDMHNPAWREPIEDASWDEKNPTVVTLEQVPHPQGAIFTADHRTGYVMTMVGGSDHARSQFNRTTQACRQPGSTYKPIYYSLALDQGFGYDTILNDVPLKIVDPVTGIEWTPTNLNDTLDGDVTLEYALVFSKNIPSVDIFKRVGATNVEAWARTLGFTTKIFADDALALGASCTYLDELARAFSVFARGGVWFPREQSRDWVTVRRVLAADGTVLEDNTVAADPYLDWGHRFDRLAATAGLEAPRAISERTAYLTTKLLGQMVKYGFTKTLRHTGIHAAGKTGTSSDTHDTSFVAFTSRFVTAVWLGDDKKQRALGKADAAFMTVVPLWARYMYEAAREYPNPEIPWQVPAGGKPLDRGDHKRGERGPQMDLIYRHAEKPDPSAAAPPG